MTQRTPMPFMPILIGSCVVILFGFGLRSAFGLFQIPIAEEFGWPRAEFSLALAIQNIAWGIGAPILGAFAERFGDRRAIALSIVLYASGLAFSAFATTPLQHHFLEFLIGFGIAGTGAGLLLAVVSRAASDENRAMAMAIVTAVSSGGQILGPPFVEYLLTIMTWQSVFLVMSAMIFACLLVLPMMKIAPVERSAAEASMGAIVSRAFRDPSYTLIFLGFFSCGYQVGFLTAHFPAFVAEVCGPISPGSLLDGLGISTTSALGAVSLSLIGIANVGGVLLTGWMAKRIPRKQILAVLYAMRTVFSIAFILTPMTPMTVILFSVCMGAVWLATVPLTAGLVGYIYGLRYMATLYGVVFLSHQIGSFLGIWLGGRLYDATGDYTLVWWIGIAVGAFSVVVHLPVRERPLAQPA